MPEETTASASAVSMDEKPCSSNAAAAADGLEDVLEEAKKLIGTGNRHMVMGDVVSAVGVFQEACGMLAEKYGDTADECGEAFFLCGKSLLELARMENTVLGDALEGVPEESSEEGEKQNDSKIESADNLDEKTRDELRVQVYDAMAEKRNMNGDSEKAAEVSQEKGEEVEGTEEPEEMVVEAKPEVPKVSEKVAGAKSKVEVKSEEKPEKPKGLPEKEDEEMEKDLPEEGYASATKSSTKNGVKDEETTASKDKPAKVEKGVKKSDENGHGETKEDEKMDEGDDDDDDDDEDDDEENADKESEDEVGNLQLAWEMLEVAKVIYKRKEGKEDQLMMAQIFLKLGEVGAESGNYGQALEDFQECLALQLKHLSPHSRLLAETHYQLGITFSFTNEYRQAIEHFNSSIKVIETRVAMLQKAIDKAEETVKEDQTELEELTQLLPEIKDKIEDAKESQRTAAAASVAIQQTMGGASTSSAFPTENGGASSSSSTVNQISVKPSKPVEGAASSKSASDISHLVKKKRKPEEECPKQASEAKKVKQEATINGSGDSASNGKGVQEKKKQEAS